jgi:hypothetical protein
MESRGAFNYKLFSICPGKRRKSKGKIEEIVHEGTHLNGHLHKQRKLGDLQSGYRWWSFVSRRIFGFSTTFLNKS